MARFLEPRPQYCNANGVPYATGSLTFYASGTSTPLATYSNPTLTTTNDNPVVLGSDGRPVSGAGAPISIWMQDRAYKVVVKDALGAVVDTIDPYYGGPGISGALSLADYGADPTGVADSTTAIRNWLAAGSKHLFAPAGTYRVTDEIDIPTTGVRIDGDGRGLSIFSGTGILTAGAAVMRLTAPSHTALPDLSLNAAKMSNTLTFASAPSLVPGDVIFAVNLTVFYTLSGSSGTFTVGESVTDGTNSGVVKSWSGGVLGVLRTDLTGIYATSATLTGLSSGATGTVSAAGGSFNRVRSYYASGQFFRVHSVSGSTVTVVGSVHELITAAQNKLYKFNGARLEMEGLSVVGPTTGDNWSLYLQGGLELSLRHMAVTGGGKGALSVDQTFGCGLVDVQAIQRGDSPAGYNYGFVGANSEGIKADANCWFEGYRHGATLGGGSDVLRVPNRGCVFNGCTIKSSSGSLAADFHGNTSDCKYLGCTIDGGVVLSGENNEVSHNTIKSSNTTGTGGCGVYCSEFAGANHLILGNTIDVVANASTAGGFLDIGGNSDAGFLPTTRAGTLVFRGNKCRDHNLSGPTANPVYVRNRGMTDRIDLVIEDNVFEVVQATDKRVFIDKVSGDAFDHIRYHRNKHVNLSAQINSWALVEASENDFEGGSLGRVGLELTTDVNNAYGVVSGGSIVGTDKAAISAYASGGATGVAIRVADPMIKDCGEAAPGSYFDYALAFGPLDSLTLQVSSLVAGAGNDTIHHTSVTNVSVSAKIGAVSIDADDQISADNGDAAVTLTIKAAKVQRFNTALTAHRAVTLPSANLIPGQTFRVLRTANATGAFNITVGTGPLKTLNAASMWCDVTYNGVTAAWELTAAGSL